MRTGELAFQHNDQARLAIAPIAALACVAGGIALVAGPVAVPESLVPSWWFALSAGATGLACITKRWLCVVVLALACVTASAGWSAMRLAEHGGATLDRVLPSTHESRSLVAVEGLVRTPPAPRRERVSPFAQSVPTTPGAWFRLHVEHVGAASGGTLQARGGLFVWLEGDAPTLAVGDRVRVLGMFEPTPPALNPGEPASLRWASSRSSAGSISANTGTIEVVKVRAASHLRRWVASLRSWALAALPSGDDEGSRVVRAIVLGERDPLDPMHERFARVGVSHLLAISGFHVGVLALGVAGLVRLTGERGRLELIAVLVVLGVYLLALPVRAPIVRAGIMIAFLLIARGSGRRLDGLGVLAWAGVVVLLIRPMELFTLGFQLSFGVTAALIWAMPRLSRRINSQPLAGITSQLTVGQRLARRTFTPVVLATLCWLIALPAVLWHVSILSPLSVVATLAMTPVVVLLLALGFASLACGAVWPVAGAAFVGASRAVGSLLVDVSRAIDAVPLSAIDTPSAPVLWAIAATAAIFWFAWEAGRPRREVRSSRRSWAMVGVAAVLVAWLAASWLVRAARGPLLRIDMLAVGDGTCVLVRSGNSTLMWDCGSTDLHIGRRRVVRAARELGAWRVPDIVITHPNLDHFSGVLDVVEPLSVERVWVTPMMFVRAEQVGSNEHVLLAELRARGVEVLEIAAGAHVEIGEATLGVVWPPAGEVFERANDGSLVGVLRVGTDAGERRVLLTGDIQRRSMQRLLASPVDLAAHAIELPHHGGWQPMSAAFVERVDPQIVLQSTGPSRLGDERWMPTRRGRWWGVTAADGALFVEVDRDGTLRRGGHLR